MRFVLVGFSFLLLLGAGCELKEKRKRDEVLAPVSVQASTPSSPQTGEITISYRLIDDRVQAENADVEVYYSADAGPFKPAMRGAGGDGTDNLSTAAAPGASHTFVWNSPADLGAGVFNVVIRIVPYDRGTGSQGDPGQTQAFQVVIVQPVVVPQSKVFDPKMPGNPLLEILYRVDPSGADFSVTVNVVSAASGTQVRRMVDAQTRTGGTDWVVEWDGKDDSGRFVDTGSYKVVIEALYQAMPFEAEETVHIVRLGITGIRFLDNGADGHEYQMLYHIRNTTKYTYYAIPEQWPEWALGAQSGEVADLDTNDGAARPLPSLWANLNSPPQDPTDTANAGVEDDNYNLPVCYERGALVKLRVSLGSSAASNITPDTALGCSYPLTGLPIRIVAGEATPETSGANEDVSPGDRVDFVCNTALLDALRKNTLQFTFAFEYEEGGTYHRIPGEIATVHTAYTIYEGPKLTDSATPVPPYLPWVKLVDIVCAWVDGPATADEICSILTEEVNSSLGLEYDIAAGSAHYVSGTHSSLALELSDFIDDYDSGTFSTVNCADCACLVSTLANAVGVDHKYLILGHTTGNIPLNYMLPVGRVWMIPFLAMNGGNFSYHAVATKDDGVTLSDAACRLDDDGDPYSPPHTPLLPVNLLYDYYNDLLSRNPSQYGTYGYWRCGLR